MLDEIEFKKDPIVKIDLIFEPLTALHIGGDSEKHLKEGFDYIVKDNFLNIIDWSETLKVNPQKIDTYASALANGRIPTNDRDLKFAERFPLPAGKNFIELKRLIRNGFGIPYVPGTSIKGAILSNLIGYLVDDKSQHKPNQLLEQTVGTFNNSIQQFIKVSDVSLDYVNIVKTKVFNLRNLGGEWFYGWKDGLRGNNVKEINIDSFSTIWECFSPHQGGNLKLAFGKVFPGSFQEVLGRLNPSAHSIYHKIIDKGDFRALFGMINQRTLQYLQAEIDFFEKFYTEENERVLEMYKRWHDELNQESPSFAILRMASGSGFHSITGNWQYPENHVSTVLNSNKKYKSRRLILENKGGEWLTMPMGFVKIQFPEDWKGDAIKRDSQDIKVNNRIESVDMQRSVTPAEPTVKNLEEFGRQGGVIDAKIVGQEGLQMKVEVYLKGLEGKVFNVRYPDGLNYFGKDSIIELDLTFPNPKNKKQFNLNNPMKK